MSSCILEGSRCFQKKCFEWCHQIFPNPESSTQKVYKVSTESPIWMNVDILYVFGSKVFEGRCIFSTLLLLEATNIFGSTDLLTARFLFGSGY